MYFFSQIQEKTCFFWEYFVSYGRINPKIPFNRNRSDATTIVPFRLIFYNSLIIRHYSWKSLYSKSILLRLLPYPLFYSVFWRSTLYLTRTQQVSNACCPVKPLIAVPFLYTAHTQLVTEKGFKRCYMVRGGIIPHVGPPSLPAGNEISRPGTPKPVWTKSLVTKLIF